MSHLTDDQVALQLQDLMGWVKDGNAISITYQFADFVQAISFMTEVAFYAESLGHYPNWHHHYNLVKIQLTTHDVNGITSHDIRLAKKMHDIARTKRLANETSVD